MKKYLLLSLLIAFIANLFGCAAQRNASPTTDLARENWQSAIATDPGYWLKGADQWFRTGDPN
ncbi:MAG TPA: hypothetical protein VHZ76_03770, partial [Gammaproteobacteria bacterium]|nr:hypothetical protein [Gammaproteobacteria bacterium]